MMITANMAWTGLVLDQPVELMTIKEIALVSGIWKASAGLCMNGVLVYNIGDPGPYRQCTPASFWIVGRMEGLKANGHGSFGAVSGRIGQGHIAGIAIT